MRKLAFMGIFVLALAAGCKDDEEGTTTPAPLPELKVTSTLSGDNEVPKNGSLVAGNVDGTLNQETRILKLLPFARLVRLRPRSFRFAAHIWNLELYTHW